MARLGTPKRWRRNRLRTANSAAVRKSAQNESDLYALIDDLGQFCGGMTFVYDLQQRRTRNLSRKLAHLLGVENGQSAGIATVLSQIHAADLPAFQRLRETLPNLTQGEVVKMPVRFRKTPDDPWRTLEFRIGAFMRNSHGKVRAVLGFVFDVARRPATSDENEQAIDAVQSAERQRIAQDLHDSTAQHLFAVDMLIGAHLHRHAEAKNEDFLQRSRETLRQAMREIRTFAFLLNPPGLSERSFADVLKKFSQEFAKRSDLHLSLDIGEIPDLPSHVQVAMFRVCQEAFMNVRRHAHAHSLSLRLFIDHDDLVMAIRDDGIGLGGKPNMSGVGFRSMIARMENLGGELSVDDRGAGTIVSARAPLHVEETDMRLAHHP